ncbi:MAG: metallophosphoesterase [Prevotella sp.]|nr:metallophosphoesterase [Prevotella sp.]
MIARILIPVLIAIVLPDLWTGWRRRWRIGGWYAAQLVLTAAMLGFTVYLALQRNFAPSSTTLLYTYLFLLGLLVVPKLVYMLCSVVGWGVRRLCGSRHNYGNLVGVLCVPLIWYVLCYGSFVGFNQLQVRYEEYASADLPAAFDGYRIVQFSDAHVGTYSGSRQWLLQRAVDSINAQHPDVIVFTGDLQNMHPQEIYPQRDILASLRAADGVFSVLGNHDYAVYVDGDETMKVSNCRETQRLERQMGWQLLMNEHRSIRRGTDSIVIAGMENWGIAERMPRLGDVERTVAGVDSAAFVVLLQHDPTCWKHRILHESNAQLTLSGHTHGGQFSLFGWSPVSLVYSEWGGLTYFGRRAINVSTGLGGLIPFRFGQPGEIVVITLKRE